jgi:hypothetical protein
MRLFRVEVKQGENQSYWDGREYIVQATNFSNCEDKMRNTTNREIIKIELFGEVTKKDDVFSIKR